MRADRAVSTLSLGLGIGSPGECILYNIYCLCFSKAMYDFLGVLCITHWHSAHVLHRRGGECVDLATIRIRVYEGKGNLVQRELLPGNGVRAVLGWN